MRVVLAIVLALPLSAHADRLPLLEHSCGLTAAGITEPSGLASTPTGLAVVDRSAATLTLVDDTCVASGGFSTGTRGALQPVGVAWDDTGARFAIADDRIGEVLFTDASGGVLGSCALWTLGVTPSGIAWDSSDGSFAVTDRPNQRVVRIDDSELGGGPCGIVGVVPTPTVGSPEGISYVPALDAFAIANGGLDNQLVGVAKDGTVLETLSAALTGVTSLRGTTYRPSDGRVLYVDDADDTLVRADIRGSLATLCSTPNTDPLGLTLNVAAGEAVLVHGSPNRVSWIRLSDCAEVRYVDVPYQVFAVAYVPTVDQLAVSDISSDTVRFLDYTTGVELGSCDTAPWGLANPGGLDWLDGPELLAATSEESWVLADLGCAVHQSRSTKPLVRADRPDTIAFLPTTGAFVAAEGDNIAVAGFTGVQLAEAPLGSAVATLTGIQAIPGAPGAFLATDGNRDTLVHIELPALAEATSLSGRFQGSGSTLTLFEDPDGVLSGTLVQGLTRQPLFGHHDAARGTVSLGTRDGAGTPWLVSGSVSGDLGSLALPAPVGTLTRF